MEISLKDLKNQYNRVKKAGWLPAINAAAALSATTSAHWLAFGSRESNLKNIRGDFRNGIWNGFGPVQVDVGTDPLFARNWRADSIDSLARGFQRGAEIYNLKKSQIINGQGKKLKVRGKNFIGKKPVAADDFRRLATAAYNSGLWSYFHWSFGENCDSTTTGKNYSRDVYDRAVEFAALLEADGEAGALAKEVKLQGKYATKEALQRAGLNTKRNLLQLPKVEPFDTEENISRAGYATEEDFAPVQQIAPVKETEQPEEIEFTEGEHPKPEETEETGGGNQTAGTINNIGTGENEAKAAELEAEKNKIAVAQSLPPVQIPTPESTDFFGKIKRLAYGVITGTIAVPFLDKIFGIQLSPEQIELMKIVFPYLFVGVFISLLVWFVTKKAHSFFLTKLIADNAKDLTTPNLQFTAKPLVQITPRPHVWARIKYAISPKPAYLWSDNPITGDAEQHGKAEPNGASSGAPNQTAGTILNLER